MPVKKVCIAYITVGVLNDACVLVEYGKKKKIEKPKKKRMKHIRLVRWSDSDLATLLINKGH